MRNAIPLRWIEQAEARQVLATALLEQAPAPSWRERARAAAARALNQARAWLAPADPSGWPVLAAQPALVRRPTAHEPRRECDGGYFSQW